MWISVGFTTGIPNSSSPVGVRTFLFKFIFIAGQWYSFRIRVETWGPSSIFSFLTHNHQFSFPSDKTPPHLQLFPSRLSLCFPKESLCSITPDYRSHPWSITFIFIYSLIPCGIHSPHLWKSNLSRIIQEMLYKGNHCKLWKLEKAVLVTITCQLDAAHSHLRRKPW